MHRKREHKTRRTAKHRSAVDKARYAEIAAACACFNFRKASRAVTQLFDAFLQPGGVRSTQFVILVGVSLTEPVNMARLAHILATDRTTLTRNLRPLVRRSLIHTAGGKDGRTRLVRLTHLGNQVLARTTPYWERAQERFIRQLGPVRWRDLLAGLTATVEATRGLQPQA